MPRMPPSRKVGDRRNGGSGGVVMTSLVTSVHWSNFQMIEPSERKQPTVERVDNTYCYVHFLQEVEQEIQRKSFMVKSGLDTYSKAELFAYTILQARGYFKTTEPTSFP